MKEVKGIFIFLKNKVFFIADILEIQDLISSKTYLLRNL